MATASPCGLSFDRTIEIIKNNVLHGKYNGREEVMQGLLDQGFTYDEAREVTDYYFKVYSKLSDEFKIKKGAKLFSATQKRERKIDDLAARYLNGELDAFPMSEEDFDHLQSIYEKEAKAETPTLKAKYIDEANVFVQKFLPSYTDELFRSAVYAKPLLSAVFFVKSFTSNFWAQIERSLTDSFYDGKGVDFTRLGKFDDLANRAMVNVFKGGIPATTLYQSESGYDPTMGRVEEYSLRGTSATSNNVKAAYWGVMKAMTKYSNRFNAAPDTRGIFHNAERHFYQLLKEHYREFLYQQYKDDGMTNEQARKQANNEANERAMQDMELDDIETATKMAEANFNELGLPITNSKGNYTTEFKVAVAEYQRLKRDDVLWRKALQLSKNDFWKKNMMVASELGFGDYGIFGLKAQALVRLRDVVEKKSKGNKLASAINLSMFGFLNGAANFSEDALERVPLYAAVKLSFLQARKGKVTDKMLQNDIMRRQKDIIVKNMTTAMFFLTAKMAEKLLCPDRAGKDTSEEIASGWRQVGPCGIPFLVPPQMLATYKAYRIIDNLSENDDDFYDTVMNLFPVLAQANQIGLGGTLDRIGASGTNIANSKQKGDEIRVKEESDKIMNTLVKYGTSVGNTWLPLPSRLMSETGTAIQRSRGMTQKQQDLPFAIDETGHKLGVFQTLGKITVSSLGNVAGISDIIIAAKGSNKQYAVDWLGRKIVQFRGSDVTGNGIQYEAADDIIATAGVRAPYIYRLTKVETEREKETSESSVGNATVTKKKMRYLTDEEFFDVSEAFGKFNKQYFDEHQDAIVESIKRDKDIEAKQLEKIFSEAKKTAIKAVQEGYKGSEQILEYINDNIKLSSLSISENELEE